VIDRGFRIASSVSAEPDEVWCGINTLAGVNVEFSPWLRMSGPPDEPLREGALGRSWVLLGGVVPVDYDDLNIVEVMPGRGFRERSTLGSAKRWHHDRTIEPLPGGGCRVTDEVSWQPRVPGTGGLQELLFAAVFRWRHRRLRERFLSRSAPEP
jgi:hypothetical protein